MSSKGDLMIGNEAVRGSPDADELLGATFDETELTQMAVTDADWLSVQVTDADLKSMAADSDNWMTSPSSKEKPAPTFSTPSSRTRTAGASNRLTTCARSSNGYPM